MNHLRACCRFLSATLLAAELVVPQQKELCPTVAGLLVTQFVFNTPVSNLPRVEIRQCGSEEALQIVAWEAKATKPALIIDTTDFTVVQSIARKNLYVIETTGGARDRVYVINFEKGKPRLVLRRITKGTAAVTVNEKYCEIVISGIYAGDAEPRTERHKFDLSSR